ncbi:MAG: LysR substrate-binding domain-containing protein [Actinomycetota bacterium]
MERPSLRQLEYAVAVADHQHFGQAARAVAVSQPGLSSQIGELEKRLGVLLFERSSRKVALTPAGAEIVERARRLLTDVDELVATASVHHGTLRGRLSLAAIPTMAPYLLPAIVQTLPRRWPELELELHEMQTEPMVAAIEAGQLDVGLLAMPVETGSLHVEPITEERFLLALPDGHALSGSSPVPVSVLQDLPVLLLEEGHCLREHAMTVCNLAGDVEHSDVRAASLATLTQMVASGIGVTLLPEGALPVEARTGAGVTTRPFESPAPGRQIALVWRRSDPRAALLPEAITDLRARLEQTRRR